MHQASNFVLPKVYRPAAPLKHIGPLSLVMILTLGLLAALTEPGDRWIILLLAGVFLITLAIVILLLFSQRLEVSTEGITYVATGYQVHSTWDNLVGHANRVLGAATVQVLVLREPGIAMNKVMSTAYRFKPLFLIAGLLQGRNLSFRTVEQYATIIPIGLFAEDWP